MPGRHLPPDPTRGDPNTIGGYIAVHDRPAAFEGADGMSYSVELAADETGDERRPYGAYFMFLRWRRMGEQGVEGHLESEFLAYGNTESDALASLGAFSLAAVREQLETLLASRADKTSRRWYDVMKEDDA